LSSSEKKLFSLFPSKLSVDTLTSHNWRGLSTLSYLLTVNALQSVDKPQLARVVNTSTLYFQGNTKNNFFHAKGG
jgi:hypothetical protein